MRPLRMLLSAAAVWLVTMAAPALADESRAVRLPQPKAEELEHLSGYDRIPTFGGPPSVPSQLRADHTPRTTYRTTFLTRRLRPYYAFKERLLRRYGLSYGLDYSVFYQYATARPDWLDLNPLANSWTGFVNCSIGPAPACQN